MKTRLVIAVTTLAAAGVAHATVVGMEWANTPNQETTVPPNTNATLRFYLANGSTNPSEAPIVEAMGIVFNAWLDPACTVPANNVWLQTSVTPLVPGWSLLSVNNNTYLNGLQYAAIGGVGHTVDWSVAYGKNYVMDVAVKYTSLNPPSAYYLTINKLSSPIVDNTGMDYMSEDSLWYGSGFATAGKSRWGFGNWGGSAWSRYNSATQGYESQAANPLIVRTPEPCSLVLLVIGACAGLRRAGSLRGCAAWARRRAPEHAIVRTYG